MKRTRVRTNALLPEYDLRQLLKGAVRGKYAKRYRAARTWFRWILMSERPFPPKRLSTTPYAW